MFQKIKFSFFNIFLLCIGFGILFFGSLNSHAQSQYSINVTWKNEPYLYHSYSFPDNRMCCFFVDTSTETQCYVYSLEDFEYHQAVYQEADHSLSFTQDVGYWDIAQYQGQSIYIYRLWTAINKSLFDFSFGAFPLVSSQQEAFDYLLSFDSPVYDETLTLTDFNIVNIANALPNNEAIDNYASSFRVSWSDNRIYRVKVRIAGSLGVQDWIGYSSPYSSSFNAGNFANLNGEYVKCIATPYDSVGHYGPSLYYNLEYKGNGLITNLWRKLNPSTYFNNTIDIPYNGNDYTYPVDGVETTTCYKVNYNPEYNTFEGDTVYNVYYSPVVIIPYETPSAETQNVINYVTNNYVTNNYNNFYNNLDLDFDFNFNDVSAGDIQQMYDDTTGMISLIGNLFGLIGTLFATCFPFLMFDIPGWLLFFGGLFLVAAGIGLFIKIVSFFRG